MFDAIADKANRLIGGFSTAVLRYIDGAAHLAAFTPTDPAGDRVRRPRSRCGSPNFRPTSLCSAGRQRNCPIPSSSPPRGNCTCARLSQHAVRAADERGRAIGIIIVTRRATGAFGEHHVRLLQTFADQAVIAIENARLFNEVQQRTTT